MIVGEINFALNFAIFDVNAWNFMEIGDLWKYFSLDAMLWMVSADIRNSNERKIHSSVQPSAE